MLQAIAMALAGRAGCRLARALQAMASRSTLLRLVMTVPDPAVPAVRGLLAAVPFQRGPSGNPSAYAHLPRTQPISPSPGLPSVPDPACR